VRNELDESQSRHRRDWGVVIPEEEHRKEWGKESRMHYRSAGCD